MRILVLDKSIVKGRLTDTSGSFIRHLEYWHAGYNQVDLLARTDEKLSKRSLGKVNLLKTPKSLFLFSLLYSYYYLIFKSKKYDLVIENWGNKPLYSLVFNTQRSLVTIFSRDFKIRFTGKLVGFIYRKINFLVNTDSNREQLINAGIKSNNIKFISDGVSGHKYLNSGNSQFAKKNKILIICGKDYKKAISIINLIERKSLDWKFVVLVNKNITSKIKSEYKSSGITSSLKIITLTSPVFKVNLVSSRFLIVTDDLYKILEYVTDSFLSNTPVLIEGNNSDIKDKKIRSNVLIFDNQMNIASKVLSLSKNDSEYKNLQVKISKVFRNYTWDEVGRQSLKYIESL